MTIAIVGLGYVGIQLAVALGRKHQVVGLDLDEQKITDLSLIHISEPTRPERIWVGGVWL